MSAPLYMVKVEIVPQKDGIDLARYIQKIHHCLAGYHNASKVLHRFKVSTRMVCKLGCHCDYH